MCEFDDGPEFEDAPGIDGTELAHSTEIPPDIRELLKKKKKLDGARCVDLSYLKRDGDNWEWVTRTMKSLEKRSKKKGYG